MLAIVGVAAAAVLALAVPLAVGAGRLYREDEVLSLERDATAAARGFDASAQAGDPVEFDSSPDDLAAYDRDGRLLSGAGPAKADPIVQESLTTGRVIDASTDDELVVAVPILANERVAGAIRASRSTVELSERIMRMRLTIAAVAAAIIALAAVAALAVSRRLTRPVFQLADAAAAIEGGRGDIRSPRSGISELDTVAEALDETAARLGAVVARERSFSADASHQLRTPLAALRLELETAQLDGREVSESLRQVDRLEGTINTLLAAARDVESQSEPFDLGAVIEDVRRAWTGVLAEHGRPLEISAPRDLPKAKATAGAVREIIDVLITNAIHHGDGAIRLTARPLGHSIAIDVSDQGPGVTDPSTAFERRTTPGRGVGLALARSLAEADGGRLDLVDHRVGETKFTLLLPAEN